MPGQHILDVRNDDPLPAPDLTGMRSRRTIDSGTGWALDLRSGRRPGSAPAVHDWAVVLTDPTGETATVLGRNSSGRFQMKEVTDALPGLIPFLEAPSKRQRRLGSGAVSLGARAAEEARCWTYVPILHAVVRSPHRWLGTAPGEAVSWDQAQWAADWASAGVASAAHAIAWAQMNVYPALDRDGTLPWHRLGFTPEQTKAWLPLEIDAVARTWFDAGRPAEQALAWADALGLPLQPGPAAVLEAAGWNPGLLVDLFAALEVAGNGRMVAFSTYLGHLLWPTGEQARIWQSLQPGRLVAYLWAGIADLTEIDDLEARPNPPRNEDLAVLRLLRGDAPPPGLLTALTT